MPEAFVRMLEGGHPNSLGRTEEVVRLVLADRSRLEELFETTGSGDPVVRLRAGDALEKVCRERPDWLLPHVDRLLDSTGQIDQPSVQWHVAQMMAHLRTDLSSSQRERATRLLQRYLSSSTDWIVLNVTMDVLARWSPGDPELSAWLAPELERLTRDPRRSVARRAGKRRTELAG